MTTSKDIKEPPCPLDESRFKGSLTFVDGTLTYYINRRNKAYLLWSFWFNYAESPYYADPAIENKYYPSLTSKEDWVEYCETTIIKESDIPQREKNYPLGYRRLSYRLDFYVTKQEFKQAFRNIQRLGRKIRDERVREAVIFGSLRVIMLDDDEFEECVEPAPNLC